MSFIRCILIFASPDIFSNSVANASNDSDAIKRFSDFLLTLRSLLCFSSEISENEQHND